MQDQQPDSLYPVTRKAGSRKGPASCLTFTVEEAAELLGIGRSLAYELACNGELPGCKKLGGRYIVSRVALLAFLGEVAA